MTAEAEVIVTAFRAANPAMEQDFARLTPSNLYFDKDGSPLSSFEFAALFESTDYRRIAWDEIPPHGYISTVWLGLDHNFRGSGPPIIFETMVFLHEAESKVQVRYATLEDAIRGHAFYLEQARGDILSVIE
jgi:hypothetical protein